MTDKELFNELSYKRKNVYENLSEQEYKEMFELCDEYFLMRERQNVNALKSR